VAKRKRSATERALCFSARRTARASLSDDQPVAVDVVEGRRRSTLVDEGLRVRPPRFTQYTHVSV
jgi:hypothetical protein